MGFNFRTYNVESSTTTPKHFADEKIIELITNIKNNEDVINKECEDMCNRMSEKSQFMFNNKIKAWQQLMDTVDVLYDYYKLN